MTAASVFARPRPLFQSPALTAAIIVAAIAVGIGLGGQVIARQVTSGLLLGSIYMTVAVAFTLTIGVLNFLNFTIPTLLCSPEWWRGDWRATALSNSPAAGPGSLRLSSASPSRYSPP